MEQPAVMDLNMRAASLGTMILRHLLQPFLLKPLPITINENLATYTMLAINTVKAANPQCSICRTNDHAGFGDLGPEIGLDPATARSIIGHDGWHASGRCENPFAPRNLLAWLRKTLKRK